MRWLYALPTILYMKMISCQIFIAPTMGNDSMKLVSDRKHPLVNVRFYCQSLRIKEQIWRFIAIKGLGDTFELCALMLFCLELPLNHHFSSEQVIGLLDVFTAEIALDRFRDLWVRVHSRTPTTNQSLSHFDHFASLLSATVTWWCRSWAPTSASWWSWRGCRRRECSSSSTRCWKDSRLEIIKTFWPHLIVLYF